MLLVEVPLFVYVTVVVISVALACRHWHDSFACSLAKDTMMSLNRFCHCLLFEDPYCVE